MHLSVVLGRPQLFHDEDVDAELPADIEDDSLIESKPAASTSSAGFSTMLAPLAHIKYVPPTSYLVYQSNLTVLPAS